VSVDPNRLLALLRDIESATETLDGKPAVREIGEQVRSGSAFGSRPPVALDVLDLLDPRSNRSVLAVLVESCLAIHERRVIDGLDAERLSEFTMPAACRYLRGQIAYVVTTTYAETLVADWSALRNRLAGAPGSPLFREVLERTPCINVVHDVVGGRSCVGMIETRVSVIHGRDREQVVVTSRCDACGRIYTDEAMARAHADQDAAVNLVTAAEAVERLNNLGLTVTTSQIRQWGVRGTVEKRRLRGAERTYNLTELARVARSSRNRATVTDVGTVAPTAEPVNHAASSAPASVSVPVPSGTPPRRRVRTRTRVDRDEQAADPTQSIAG
jgi:hypothetical protein